MATSDQFSVIILDSPTQAQRNAVHDRVKKATKSWWHSYDDVWIVRSENAPTDWINRLQSIFKSGPGSFLVLGLPETSDTRTWGYFGPNPVERVAWLHRNYTRDTH